MSSSDRTPRPTAVLRTRAARTAAASVAVLASVALVAGCASATGGTTTGGGGAGSAAPAAATSAANTPSLTALATRVATAVSRATSVHLTSDLSGVSVLPIPVGTVTGDVALTNGRPTAASITAGVFAVRYVDGRAWVQLPGAAAATPWTLVSPTSSNPIVAMAATRLEAARTQLAGLDPVALLGAASDLREVGAGEVDGVAATQYSFTVDPSAVAKGAGADAAAQAKAAQVGTVPVQVWLDAADRPVRVTAWPTLDGSTTPVTVTLSAWNAPVTITAPAASQVTR